MGLGSGTLVVVGWEGERVGRDIHIIGRVVLISRHLCGLWMIPTVVGSLRLRLSFTKLLGAHIVGSYCARRVIDTATKSSLLLDLRFAKVRFISG
jgi:hypothetical protein